MNLMIGKALCIKLNRRRYVLISENRPKQDIAKT